MKFKTALFLIFILMIFSGCSLLRKKTQAEEPTPTPRAGISEPVNVIDISQRPYLTITPNNNGRNIYLRVNKLNKSASQAEYELEYQSGELLQGAFGFFDFSTEPVPAQKDILLGSCSAGGKCSYHENVKGGTLTMKFTAGETYAIKTEWRFDQTQGSQGKFSSRDGKFQISTEKTLASSAYIIIMNTSGLPETAVGDVIAGPYAIFPSQGLPKSGKAELTLRLNEESSTAKIYGWNGTEWKAFDTNLDGKTATATVDLLETFIAIK